MHGERKSHMIPAHGPAWKANISDGVLACLLPIRQQEQRRRDKKPRGALSRASAKLLLLRDCRWLKRERERKKTPKQDNKSPQAWRTSRLSDSCVVRLATSCAVRATVRLNRSEDKTL